VNLPALIPSRAQRNHTRGHGRHPIEGCWRCQRDYAKCVTKITYLTRQDGEAVAAEINQANGWTEPVKQYPCDWGTKERPHWHIGHVRGGQDLKRARRQWRLWVASNDQKAAS
jgi:hypothetical protein